jgi:fibronectin type 3 domain-containing protein
MIRHALVPCLLLTGASLQAQVAASSLQPARGALSNQPVFHLRSVLPANLLPAGKTVGTFHLTGLVRADRTVVLRWANDQGEMPTEGVHVFRQKVGQSGWKDLTGRTPVGFLQGKAALKGLKALPAEDREGFLAYPFGNVQHDLTTRLRLPGPVASGPARARDLSPEKSLQAFRALRASGQLNRTDLQLMDVRADADADLAEALGLVYTDDPGKGEFRYKIEVMLPEGGSVEAIAPQVFNTRIPTPVPQPINLTATSGNGEVLLNWDAPPSDAVAGYNIYRAENPGGPWTRLNTDLVKQVQIELEDPQQTLRRAIGLQDTMARMLQPLPPAARTPQKVAEAERMAYAQIQQPGALPALSPQLANAIQAEVAAGHLRQGGLQAPRSLYTDSRRTAGNTLQDEHTYQYRVVAVDIGGREQPTETAPVVAGTPKDLDPPQVPGQPMLAEEVTARTALSVAQAARARDSQLVALDQAAQARGPQLTRTFPPVGAQGASPTATSASVATGLSLAETRQLKLARIAATMPVGALKQLGEACAVQSNPDGSVPPTRLVWTPSPDADLQGYQVFRARGDDAFQKVADTATPDWTDTTLEVGQVYRYAVSAVDKLGNVSARSPEGRVEVRDSRLPGRLAVQGLAGLVVQDLPPQTIARRLFRPASQIMASGTLRALQSPIQIKMATTATVTAFRPAKTVLLPKADPGLMAFRTAPPAVHGLIKAPAAALRADQLSAQIKPVFLKIPRSFNPMLAAPAASKQLQVLLTWSRPIEGYPMEYVIEEAPQGMQLVTSPRPPLAFQHGFQVFTPASSAQATGSLKPMHLPAEPPSPGPQAPAREAIVITPALRAAALKGLVASQGAGLRAAVARQDVWTHLEPMGAPGAFSRVNDTPVTTERYAVTFPAEASQYGGATFYFRVRAYTLEFGHTVAGPVSDPIAVRLPDVLPPPSPAPGAVDLRERPDNGLDAVLSWTQPTAQDLAGVVVDRQAMTFTLVAGEAQAGAPKGAPARLTPAPVPGLAFTDPNVPPGYQRYTFRSVDHTGNISEPIGSLDILVPGEPVPGAPGQVAVQGNRLVWQAAPDAAGYTVWRSFSGQDGDWTCISGILAPSDTSFPLPATGDLHLRVVARSPSGMWSTPSQPVERKL